MCLTLSFNIVRGLFSGIMPVDKSVRNITAYVLLGSGVLMVVAFLVGAVVLLGISGGVVIDTEGHDVTYGVALTDGFLMSDGQEFNYDELTSEEQALVDEAMQNGSVVVDNTSVLPAETNHRVVGVDEETGEEYTVPMNVQLELYMDVLRSMGVFFVVGVVSFFGGSTLLKSREGDVEDVFG